MKCSVMLLKSFIVGKPSLASFTRGRLLVDRYPVLFQAFFIKKSFFTSLTVIVPWPVECSPMLAQGFFIGESSCADLTKSVDLMHDRSVLMQSLVIGEPQLASFASLCVGFGPMLLKCDFISKSTVAMHAIAMSCVLLMIKEPGNISKSGSPAGCAARHDDKRKRRFGGRAWL